MSKEILAVAEAVSNEKRYLVSVSLKLLRLL